MPDIFISYSRKDKPFVEKLVKALQSHGKEIWIDWQDIPFASDWWEEICRGIEGAQAGIFVISPDSLESRVCGMEIDHITKNNKRLIPILYREETDKTLIPPVIGSHNWIFFNTPETFDDSVSKLIKAVDTDLEALHQHTRLLVRAKEWEKGGHSDSLLLRGDDLEDMLIMLNRTDITDLQRQFLQRSRQYNLRAQVIWRFQCGFTGGLLGMGTWTFSVFRSPILITPERIRWTIAMGGAFGVFIGLIAALAGDLPMWQRYSLPKRVNLALRVVLTLVLSVLAWMSYIWFLDSISFTRQDFDTWLLGGVGLAAGFIVRLLSKAPAWLATLITLIATWLPIYIASGKIAGTAAQFVPLVFFDIPDQVFSIGIPMTILIALGANFPALSHDLRAFYRILRMSQLKTEKA